jgi:tetratricopeptide (TPR) repeat protein
MAPHAARSRRRLIAAIALLLLVAAGLLQWRIDARERGRGDTAPLLYLPSGRMLRVLSLGFDDILADVLYLWSIQYYSNYRIEDRYLYLETIYRDVITELDPRYIDAYLTGALIMSAEARQPEAALRLLDRGIARNPSEWILAFDAGFLCYDVLKDYGRAAAYFEKALASPEVHPQVRRFYAAMRERTGDTRTSLAEWIAIYDSADTDYVRTVAWNHVHDLKVKIDLADLSDAVARFRAERGRLPHLLEDLRRAGILKEIPRDPEGGTYLYAPTTGEVAYGGSPVLGR